MIYADILQPLETLSHMSYGYIINVLRDDVNILEGKGGEEIYYYMEEIHYYMDELNIDQHVFVFTLKEEGIDIYDEKGDFKFPDYHYQEFLCMLVRVIKKYPWNNNKFVFLNPQPDAPFYCILVNNSNYEEKREEDPIIKFTYVTSFGGKYYIVAEINIRHTDEIS